MYRHGAAAAASGSGNNSPFGTQFGWYANLLCEQGGAALADQRVDPRNSRKPAVVTFTIRRDGSVTGTVRASTQAAAIATLDISAQRAILDAAPFPPLPPQFPRSEAEVELRFSLK